MICAKKKKQGYAEGIPHPAHLHGCHNISPPTTNKPASLLHMHEKSLQITGTNGIQFNVQIRQKKIEVWRTCIEVWRSCIELD
jgi:hypothetical protein